MGLPVSNWGDSGSICGQSVSNWGISRFKYVIVGQSGVIASQSGVTLG